MLPGSMLVRRYSGERVLSRILACCVDLVAFACSTCLAFELRFDGALPADYFRPMGIALCIWAATKSLAFRVARESCGHWRHTSAHDAVRVALANIEGSIIGGLAIVLLLGPTVVPRSVYIVDWLVSCILTLGARLMVRAVGAARWFKPTGGQQTRTLIYGAGAAGLALLRELLQNQNLVSDVIGLIDDDRRKADLNLLGKKVLGTGKFLSKLVRQHGISKVLVAIPSATGQDLIRILKSIREAEVEYKMVPSLGELIQGRELGKQVRDIAVEDLLCRKPVHLDQERIRDRIQGKVVMVTGAAGSIGSEVCRQIAAFGPLALVGFDAAETPLTQIDRELRRRFPGLTFHPEIGDITRPDTLRRVMQQYQPSIVYHAAAYKHVPMMEKHPFAAVENNVFGTWQVALAAINQGVEDFVLISSDKAVRPTSIMGSTKRMAELVIRTLQQTGRTKFVTVRFGNVLGSSGSVVPIFKEQIAAGGPVTVTHPEMRRYFMTIPEAAQLVLQAFAIGQGGEVFVLDMGDPVKIVDLARNLILLSGLQPDRDIRIQFCGVRPGEKVFEELNLEDEHLAATSHPKIRSFVYEGDVDPGQITAYLHDLQDIVEDQDLDRLVRFFKKMIPDYHPDSGLFQGALQAGSPPVSMHSDNVSLDRARGHETPRRTSAILTN